MITKLDEDSSGSKHKLDSEIQRTGERTEKRRRKTSGGGES